MKIFEPEKIAEQMNNILKQFSNGEIIENISRTYLVQTNVPSDKWSRLNKILMLRAGTKDGRNYDAWIAAGRHVIPGRKAFRILAPYQVQKKVWNKDTKTYEIEKYWNDQQKKFVPVMVTIGFRPQPEFRYEDTEGLPVEYVEQPKNLPSIKAIAARFGLTVQAERSVRGEWGSYDHIDKHISLSTSDVATFFHELVHHAHNIVLAKKGDKLKGGQVISQEIVAEFGSLVLVNMLGLKDKKGIEQNLGFTLAYIKGYINSRDNEKAVEAVKNLFVEIIEVLDLILTEETVHKKEVKEGLKITDKIAKKITK